MRYLPVGLEVRGRSCAVVGGGKVGTRKVLNLLRAGAEVTLISPQATTELARLAGAGRVRWVREPFRDDHLHGVFLAVAATDNDGLNARLVQEARARGVLVCDASSAERSEVIFGAVHQGDGFAIAVFTDGQDPSRAREVRDRIALAAAEWEDIGTVEGDTQSEDTGASPGTSERQDAEG